MYAASIPCGPINDVEEALADEQTAARGLVVETEHPRFGPIRQLASPVKVGPNRPTYRRAPLRNEDMAFVLEQIANYDADKIAKLTADGAFGPDQQATAYQSTDEIDEGAAI
jgi:crotonobetainyl-CoA:carnitine CoA-transferase CaiB-like acyl-CoA transferase